MKIFLEIRKHELAELEGDLTLMSKCRINKQVSLNDEFMSDHQSLP